MSNDDVPDAHEGDYDGIRELDNPLPAWWMATFLITIIFGFLYWIHYEFGGGQTQWAELANDLAAVERIQAKAGPPAESEETLANLLASSEAAAEGSVVYAAKCAACHGPQLQGLIGPNLTDEFWLHGRGDMKGVIEIVRKGVLDKGMPPWEGQMKEREILAVSVYILKQKGTNPPNPKPPQGEKFVHN